MNNYLKISLLGVGHLLVDLCTVYLINSLVDVSYMGLAIYFVVYNLIAFAFQPVVGYLADKYNIYRHYLMLGLLLPLLMLLMPGESIILVIVGTIGNAMYHVGGGVVSINLFPNKVAPAGIFVAPGAIGVYLGVLLSTHSYDYSLLIVSLTLFVTVLLYLTFKLSKEKQENLEVSNYMGRIVVLIFIIVLIRGLIGLNIQYPWTSNIIEKGFLVLGLFVGKFIGGMLADRYGLLSVGLIGLLSSIPFILLGYSIPILGIVGALLFNVTMAITLYVIVYSLGKYKGFAFGLTTLALFISYVPNALGFSIEFNAFYIISIITLPLIASFLLYKVALYFNNHKEVL